MVCAVTPPIRQLDDPGSLAPLRVAAVIGVTPQDLERHGFQLVRDEDDLGVVHWAWLQVGRYHVLVSRHEDSPDPGTELHVPESEDAIVAVRDAVAAFGLGSKDVTWLAPDIPERAVVPS